jgi:hypothetical protein
MADKKPTINSRGIFYNRPLTKAPDHVMGELAINVENFIKWLLEQERTKTGYVHLQINTNKIKDTGEEFIYLCYNQWKHDYEKYSKETPENYKAKPKPKYKPQVDPSQGGDNDLPW